MVCRESLATTYYLDPNNELYQSNKPLRKHAYSNIKKISAPKTENFQIKISDIFHISAQKIDCGYSLEPPRWGCSNDYPQSMFLSRNKKNNVYPCKPQFHYIKVGFKGVNIILACFREKLIFFSILHEIICCGYSSEVYQYFFVEKENIHYSLFITWFVITRFWI